MEHIQFTTKNSSLNLDYLIPGSKFISVLAITVYILITLPDTKAQFIFQFHEFKVHVESSSSKILYPFSSLTWPATKYILVRTSSQVIDQKVNVIMIMETHLTIDY